MTMRFHTTMQMTTRMTTRMTTGMTTHMHMTMHTITRIRIRMFTQWFKFIRSLPNSQLHRSMVMTTITIMPTLTNTPTHEYR